MTVENFYDFRENGVITSKTAKRRVFFLAARTWIAVETELFKVFSTGATVLLNQMGKSYGFNLAREAKQTQSDPAKVLGSLRILAGVSGWGDATITGDTQTGKSLEIRMKNCIFCTDTVKQGSPACHFLAGVVNGVADEAYGVPHNAVETSCARAGAESCVISIQAAG